MRYVLREKYDEAIIPATNGKKYEVAMECYESGEYEEAIELFEELAESNYEDSKDKISEVKYTQALEYYEDEDYEEALPIFMELGWYTDAHDYYEECLINVATPVMSIKYIKAGNIMMKFSGIVNLIRNALTIRTVSIKLAHMNTIWILS